MSQATKKLTINGSVNLGAALKAAGYSGNFQISHCKIVNENDGVLYVHLSNNGLTAPPVGTDGEAVGNTGDTTTFLFNQNHPEQFLDAGTTWLYAAAEIQVVVSVVGGGI